MTHNQNLSVKTALTLLLLCLVNVFPAASFAIDSQATVAPVTEASASAVNEPGANSPVAAAKDDTLTEIMLPTAFLKCTVASKAYVSDDCATVELFDGDVFIMAKKPMRIISRSVELSLAKDSIVAISTADHVTKVHSLSIKPVSIVANGFHEKLNIGEEMVCADSLSALQMATQTDSIERRVASVLHFEQGDDRILRCEYSPLSMMKHNKIFREVFRSCQTDKKAIAQRLLKVTIALAYATASHGQYLQVEQD